MNLSHSTKWILYANKGSFFSIFGITFNCHAQYYTCFMRCWRRYCHCPSRPKKCKQSQILIWCIENRLGTWSLDFIAVTSWSEANMIFLNGKVLRETEIKKINKEGHNKKKEGKNCRFRVHQKYISYRVYLFKKEKNMKSILILL